MGLGLGLTHHWIKPNFNFGANNCPLHTLWPDGHIVYIKTPKNIILHLFPIMRPKIQLSAHDMEFQWQVQVELNQMRKQLLIPQEKVPDIIMFNPPTFVLPPPKDTVPLNNKHPTSYLSNSGSSSFFLIRNLFSLSKINPFILEKGKKKPSPFIFLRSRRHHRQSRCRH